MTISKETLNRIKNNRKEDDEMIFSTEENNTVQLVNSLEESNTISSNEDEIYNVQDIIEEQTQDGATQEAILVEAEVDDNEEAMVKDVLSNAKSVSAKNISRIIGKAGALTIVNAKTGNRISIAKECYSGIGNLSTVQFALTDTSLIIGEKVLDNDNNFNVKESNGRGIIYSSALVKEITEHFNLDFSNKTSLTFSDVQYSNADDVQIMIVKIK